MLVPASQGSTGAEGADRAYARRLLRNESVWWKQLLDVQRPYRAHLRRLQLGRVLEIGCGIGRNLLHLGDSATGVDINPEAIAVARSRGGNAFTADDFRKSEDWKPGRFDSLLLAHVAEHMTGEEAAALLRDYLGLLRPGGMVVAITPQEAGFRSDPTHVQFMDFESVRRVFTEAGITCARQYSFPLPRLLGRLFKYNEFVSIGRLPDAR